MNKVSGWLAGCGHDPFPWNNAVHLGKGTLIDQLIRITHEVDGAIFIFAEDDHTTVRGEKRPQPRDNVIFEYGLFMGTLGAGSVVFLRVGKANIATDLRGVVYLDLPNAPDIEEEEKARDAIVNWAKNCLAPGYIKGLGFDLAKHLMRLLAEGKPVGNILGQIASRLVAGNTCDEIKALCSDKGEYSEEYYKMQFNWVKNDSARCIKRVFVRSRGDDYGFTPGETLGIKMHLDQAANGVEIRWIFADSPWLGGPYSSSLGLAIFGKGWIIHWLLESGAFSDGTQEDYGVLKLLEKRFGDLWDHSEPLDPKLISKVVRQGSVDQRPE